MPKRAPAFLISWKEDQLTTKTFHLPDGGEVKVLHQEQIICLDETHLHKTPVQIIVAMDINGHKVDVHQDGSRFNVRIDESLVRCNLTVDQAVDFVKGNTS